MSRVSYKRLKKNIPNKIRTKAKSSFEVVWSSNLLSPTGIKLDGQTRFSPDQIVLSTDQSDKDAVHSFVHECFHALDHAYKIGLTEDQVLLLEKSYPFLREIVLTLEQKKDKV